MLLADFNTADRGAALELLFPCIGVTRWAEELVDGRPYPDREALLARAATAADPFTPGEVADALGRHPRIGERAAAGASGRERAEAALSRSEQSGVDTAAEHAAALREGNRAYERRFGRVFLIRAAGRSADEILEQLHARLGNSAEREELVAAQQLREIAVLRLAASIDASNAGTNAGTNDKGAATT